jgi:DNA repair protein RadC
MQNNPEGTRVSEALPAQLYSAPATSAPAVPFKPRERMQQRGVKTLTDTELLAVILGDSKREPSERLIRRKGLRGLDGLTVMELQELPGIGLSHAQRIVAVCELQRRVRSAENRDRPRLVRPLDVAHVVADIKNLKKEHLLGLYLDAQNGLIQRETISVGSLNTTRSHPREILYPAIEHTACGFILAHNHPSGSLEPSDEDVAFTRSVHRAGEVMGIELYDHIIVSSAGFTSLRERGLF